MANRLDKTLKELFPWYKEASDRAGYTVNKYMSSHGTAIAEVLLNGNIRYLIQLSKDCAVEFTSYFPSVEFNCDGEPLVVYEAQRNIRVKDSSPESMVEVKLMADDEDMYSCIEQEVAQWVDTMYSELSKGMSADVARRVVNRDLGESS